MVGDPDLPRRLDVARMEGMFAHHLRQVFGDRHVEFSLVLRNNLRELWRLGLEESVPVQSDMTVREEEEWAFRRRDCHRAPCAACGGLGIAVDPYQCDHQCDRCGGSGNT